MSGRRRAEGEIRRMKKTLYMETTEIDPVKTAGELAGLLSAAPGVRQTSQEYNGQGKIIAVNFGLEITPPPRQVLRAYRLPINSEPIFAILNGRRKHTWDTDRRDAWEQADRLQAERVAWRIILRWVQAQMALIETGMVSAPEVFHPYMLIQDAQTGQVKTVFHNFIESQLKALPAPQ